MTDQTKDLENTNPFESTKDLKQIQTSRLKQHKHKATKSTPLTTHPQQIWL